MEKARQTLKWDQRSEITKTLFVITIIVGVTLGGYGAFTIAMGTANPLVVVESESMLPTLEIGHLLVLQARASDQIHVGDIIVFDASYHTKPIVHRIVQIDEVVIEPANETAGTPEVIEYRYYTQGDNNDLRDPMYRTHSDIIGVVVFAIPYIGHITLFLHQPYGFAIVLVLFIALLIIPEFFMKNDDEKESEQSTEVEEQETTNA